MIPRSIFLTSALAAVGLVVASLNIYAFDRDGTMTTGMDSYRSTQIVGKKTWAESPIQILYTFMPGGVLLNPGRPGAGGFDFVERMRWKYDDNQILVDNPILDIRERDPQSIARFREMVRDSGYESVLQCPHNAELQCEVGITWNRSRTKERGIQMVFVRISELEYVIVDDSILSRPGS
jgi:hypothetical protein